MDEVKNMFRLIVCVIFIMAVSVENLSAEKKPADANTVDTASVPAAFISLDSTYALLVSKSSQQLFLYKKTGDSVALIKTYKCSTGKNRGDKIESGDMKTPEGGYFFKGIHKDEKLPSKYGVMAFVLDFPNYLDEKENKGGNGIWLHGLDKPLVSYDTQGCVALQNEDLIELSQMIKLNETPIVIEEKITHITQEELMKRKEDAKQSINEWQHAWEEKDLDRFLQCYSQEKYGSWKLNKLRKTKQDLNEKYKFIDVGLRNMNIVAHDKTIIANFIQDYESDSFNSSGYKKLYLQKNSEVLKVIGEDWIKEDSLRMSQPTNQSDERSIHRLLNTWITAWENKQIDDYMTCYSKKFSSQKMNWKQWKEYKTGINQTTRTIRVSVGKTKLNLDGLKATVSYVQTYVSDAFTDHGVKKLHIQKEDGNWKIVSETWEPI